MTPDQIAENRKWYFVGISILATAITLASAGATYTINRKSFIDWENFGFVFALLATAGIEVTFALTLYGVTYALVGWVERGIGAVLLIGAVAIMTTNYVVHHRLVTGARLNAWQIDYIQGVGPFSVFIILLLIVGILVFNDDARRRRLERETAYAAQRQAMKWEQEQLKSEAFERHMAQYKPQVFEKVRRSLTLPDLPPKRGITMAPSDSERGSDEPKNE